jgi:hypothetical protein
MFIKFAWPLQRPSDGGSGGGAAATGDKGGDQGKGGAGDQGKGEQTGEQSVIGEAAAGREKKAGGEGEDKGTGKDGQQAGAGDGKQDASQEGERKIPETYELTLPDGGRLDESDLKYVAEIAKKAGWTNEEAQAALAEQDAAIKAQSERFLAETKSDQEYGGAKLVESQKLARAVIDRIRPPGHARRESFIKFVNRGGAGNHIEVVAFLADLGKMMAEDTSTGGGGGGGEKDAASVLYGATK